MSVLSLALVSLLAALSPPALAENPADPADTPVLLVVHGDRGPEADGDQAARPGIDRAVQAFKAQGWPVYYAVKCGGGQDNYYMKDRKPTGIICSSNGWHYTKLPSRNIFLAGGQFGGCLNRAAKAALLQLGMPVFSPEGDMSLNKQALSDIKAAAPRAPGTPPVALHYIRDAIYISLNPEMSILASGRSYEAFNMGPPLDPRYSYPWVWESVRARAIFREGDGSTRLLRDEPDSAAPVLIVRATTTERLLAAAARPSGSAVVGTGSRIGSLLRAAENWIAPVSKGR